VKSPTIRTLNLGSLLGLLALPLAAAPRAGKISGVVLDPSGTPQMGATVLIAAEQLQSSRPLELLTNAAGHFDCAELLPGLYSVRVTLAGFLPAIEEHIRVEDHRTTLLQIELGSIFASLERLRRQPNQMVDADEWTWVLRTSSATRPVLRWDDGEVLLAGQPSQAEQDRKNRPRGTLQLTSGTRHPGSVSNLADSPSTAFAFDQGVGPRGRLLLAGQVSHESAASAGGMATVWIPSGDPNQGPITSLVLRESKLGPAGPTFRGLRMEHSNQLALGDRISVRYGAEYVMAGLDGNSSAVRPRADVTVQLAPTWRASMTVSASPWRDSVDSANPLQSALDELDAFPTLLVRHGHSVLASDWHEELAVEHPFGPKASVVVSAFHDRTRNTALFGTGEVANPDFLQDFFSDAFTYDGGAFNSWGTRVAYRQKLTDYLDATLTYAWAGALALDASSTGGDLRDMLDTRYRHSLAARVSSHVPRTGTQFSTSYKWVNRQVVSHQDAYGEATFGMDPYMNLVVRQPLPSFFACRMAALVDFGNLLAQGYVPVTTRDGRVFLVPSYRSFKGGVSFQF
jgi:hypothetical protein